MRQTLASLAWLSLGVSNGTADLSRTESKGKIDEELTVASESNADETMQISLRKRRWEGLVEREGEKREVQTTLPREGEQVCATK